MNSTGSLVRRWRSASTCVSLSLLGGSCGELTESPPSHAVPVVQLLLISGQSTQVATLGFSAPAEPLVAATLRPIEPESVTLALVAPDGRQAALVGVPGSPGRYQAELLVVPGETYGLAGKVAGLEVSASVTTPGPLHIVEPVNDTLVLGSNSVFVSLDFKWSATGAASYLVQQTDPQFGLIQGFATSDTIGALPLISQAFGQPDTNGLVIWAYEAQGASFFLNREVTSSPASGEPTAVVGFGGATPAVPEKTILWQPE